jgi:hypothetical protein
MTEMYKLEQMERNSIVPREGDLRTVRLRKVSTVCISNYENSITTQKQTYLAI